MRQGKAEAIQSISVVRRWSLQNSSKIALDEKMRGHWHIRTSALSEQEIAGIRIVTEGSTGLSAVKRAMQLTIDSTRREEVRDDRREQEARGKTGSAGDNFHTLSDGEEAKSETDLESLEEQDMCTRPMHKAEYEEMIGLREARKNCSMRQKPRGFCKKGDDGRERVTSNRSKSIQELKKETTCNRHGALGHWEDRVPSKRDRVIDPAEAEGSENNRFQERGHRKAKAKVGESSLKRLVQFKRSTVVTLKQGSSSLGSAGLRRG